MANKSIIGLRVIEQYVQVKLRPVPQTFGRVTGLGANVMVKVILIHSEAFV